MAKRYSKGETSGKKASIFTATDPDGTVLKSRSFFIHSDVAFIGAYQFKNEWFASGVTDGVKDWGSQIFLKAHKIK